MRDDAVVVFDGFSYRYPKRERLALRDLDLEIARGTFLAVIGPTGAGKTTLCLALDGIVPHFFGGEVYGALTVAGLDTTEHPTYELARHVGITFEDPEMQLTAPSVLAEVAFALENLRLPAGDIRERVAEALRAVRLDGLEGKHPHQLSGGQKQRLAIASALALRPDVLVLDEPTSQLDPVGTDEVFALARELNAKRGVTIVLVTHETEAVAEYADRVLLLDDGAVVADGPPGELLADVELLRRHDLRPPEVAEVFHRVLEGTTTRPYPVRLSEAVRRVDELCVTTVPPALPPPPSGDRTGTPVLRTRDLGYRYEDGTEALRGVSLDVHAGEYVAIVGQNGAGKSTLVRHFLGLLRPTTGQVLVRGEDVTGFEVSDLAQRIGYVSQNPDNQIFSDSVEEEVAFALRTLRYPPEEVEERVAEALAEMRLEDVREHHPLTLSKGDRSRVVIAAILAMRPDILIFDEPTTGQDYAGARAILDLTRELHHAGKTVVVITHHLYLLPGYAERLVAMGEGRLLLDAPLRTAFYETATLRQTFLTPPQLVQFVEAIRPPAAPPVHALTVDEIATAVVAYASRAGAR